MSLQTTQSDSPLAACSVGDATIQKTNRESLGRGTSESCLVQIYPPDIVDGRVLLESEQLLIGRDENADMVLADSGVSRRHAELVQADDVYAIRDLGSTNGTLVNGVTIERAQILNSGDTVRIGSFIFRFLSADSVETQYHETVYNALVRDALTGTMNKRYLLESMYREIARAVRQQAPLAVTILDIDHFKSVNDTHGHLIGDEVLKEFGSRMNAISRDDDLLARYGGEEFCLLLAGTNLSEAIEITERCRLAVAETPFMTGVGELPITASFGVACLHPIKSVEPLDLIKVADEKLYEAKRSGRNRVCG